MAQDNLDPVVTTGSSQALYQVDSDPSQAPEKGGSNAVGKHTSEPSRTHEFMAGILRIVPSDADVRNPTKPHQKSSNGGCLILSVFAFAD